MTINIIGRAILKIIKLLLTLVVIIVIIASGFFWFEGKNLLQRFTPKIEKELGRKLDAEVKVADLSLKIFPSIGFSVNSISVKPHNSCGAISAEHGSLYVDLPELIEGRYIINSISLVSSHASISITDGVLTFVNESDPSCTQNPIKPNSITVKADEIAPEAFKENPILLKLENLNIEDLNLSIVGQNPHKIVISKLTSSGSFDNGIFNLIAPDIKAQVNSIPTSIAANSINFDLNSKSLTIDSGIFNLSEQIIQLSGAFQARNRFQAVKISASDIRLPDLIKALRPFKITLPAITSGTATITALLNASENNGLEVDGDLRILNFNLPSSKLKFNEINLQSTHFKNLINGDTDFSSSASLNKFSITDGSFFYASDKVQGPIRIQHNKKGLDISGRLNVSSFEFRDGLTELKNVSGQLSEIKASRDQNKNIKVSLKLNGSSVELNHPAVKINRVKSVSAPLNISVSNKGVYSVAGLVKAESGSISISNRELNEISGQVQMLISTSNKEFNAQQVSTKINDTQILTNGTFIMKPESYIFREFQASVYQGTLKADGTLLLDDSRKFSTKIKGNNLKIADILELAQIKEASAGEGNISSINLDLHGSSLNPLESLEGNGSLQLAGTTIKGFDLSRAIGSALAEIPFTNIKLSPDNLTDDGKRKNADGEFFIANQVITFSKTTIYRSNYIFKTEGKLDFNLQLDAKGSVIFAQQTLQNLGGGFDKLGVLIGKVGKVEIPLIINGTAPKFSITPDLQTFVLNNSGVTLAGKVVGTTLNAGKSVKDFVLTPFNSKKN